MDKEPGQQEQFFRNNSLFIYSLHIIPFNLSPNFVKQCLYLKFINRKLGYICQFCPKGLRYLKGNDSTQFHEHVVSIGI